ncbi:hypothetical protein FEM33_10665 [Dyadobacter flavalbus]|uniref:DUF4267 domain-containing protein n=1 Tax=Dyadobacter flavalbus TaxID=2579942 RepID=A0A5M8QYM7_9BACT|nr:hypothetical protein [Dyadobacter flavalbus]KAA6439814.1 hypothetical protein FEM33_10665 [Dyadobacter flavalbus]
MKKPIDAKTHGIIDYVFGGIQLIGPSLAGLNKEARVTYQMLSAAFTGVNVLTDTPVGLKKVLSMKAHQTADITFLAGMAALTASGMIKNDKKALAFHLGLLGLSAVNYLLTDYSDNAAQKEIESEF